MLVYLAQGDLETYNSLADLSPYYTNHLLGYGIIEKQHDIYCFKIEAVKKFLVNKLRYQKINPTQEEMLNEISDRRNVLEPKLRSIVRNQLRASIGKAAAQESILNILGEPRKSKLAVLSYEDLFSPKVSSLYFEDLRKIIVKNWETFKYIFTQDRQDFDTKMQFINKLRADAHAKAVDQNEMSYFRVCMGEIEKQVEDFLGH
jgi:hypothetical protein